MTNQQGAPEALRGAPPSAYSQEDHVFYTFWYGHMLDDLMQPPLAGVSHSTARYIWDAAIAHVAAQPAAPQGGAYAELPDVDALAQEIRRVDGANKLGAGALAEALMPFLRASLSAGAEPEPVAWRVRRKDAPNYWIIFMHYPVDAMADPEREVQPLYLAAPAQPAEGAAYALPEFDDLDDDLIDHACSAGALYRADLMRAWDVIRDGLRASRGQAPAGATLPEGWATLTITHEGQHPEEVAYGPQRMMDRLGKWLRKYFDSVAAPTAQPAPATTAQADSQPALPKITAEDRSFLHYNPNTDDIVEWVQNYANAAINADRAARAPADSGAADSVTAPAGGAVAGPWHELDGVIAECEHGLSFDKTSLATLKRVRDSLASAPTPPTQAADSVLEDAARYQWLFDARTDAQTVSVSETVFKPLPQDEVLSHLQGFYMSKAVVDALVDAARKQGANHDNA